MSILAALNALNGRLPVAAEGYTPEKIGGVVLIAADGGLVDFLPLFQTQGKKQVPKTLAVPAGVKRTVNVAANLFWDKSAYALGLTAEPKPRTADEHAAFVRRNRERLAGATDPSLIAFGRFLENWQPSDAMRQRLEQAGLMDANLVFRLDGGAAYLHDLPAAQALLSSDAEDAAGPTGICLVSGVEAPIAVLHPSIKGVHGAQSSGAAIVSFNQPAFTSYGKSQGENAPVSQAVARNYVKALNWLLDRRNGRRLSLGDMSVVFWAESEDALADEALAGIFGQMQAEPEPGEEAAETAARDNAETLKLRERVLQAMSEGRPIEDADPRLDPGTRIFILGLSPNAARLSVRLWLVDTLGDLYAHFRQHWLDLQIKPGPRDPNPTIWRLLLETRSQKSRNAEVLPNLAGDVLRTVLTGGPYPRSLLSALIMRLRAGDPVNDYKAALIKACLVRSPNPQEIPVALDEAETDPAYRLGRLFAVLENVQKAALGRDINATIRDRYYAAASATPAAVFPTLLRNANNHLAKIRKDSGKTWGDWQIGEILEGLGPRFPRSLNLDAQGRFAIGYYQQAYTRRDKAEQTDTQTQTQD